VVGGAPDALPALLMTLVAVIATGQVLAKALAAERKRPRPS
jgi:hypothetical protein